MLRVRVVSPASLTGPLVERLAAAHGVQNLVVLRAAVRRPQGDAVHFDLSDGAANPVFRELRELGLARHGSISVERVDATLTAAAPVAKAGVLRRETAPVWEMVEAVIRGGAVYAPSFYALLTIAGLIGREDDASIAVALGFSIRERPLARDGLLALLWGVLAAIVMTLLFGLAVKASGDTPAQFLQGVRPVSDLINTPNMFSVIVAI